MKKKNKGNKINVWICASSAAAATPTEGNKDPEISGLI